jgi:hypothetical protein
VSRRISRGLKRLITPLQGGGVVEWNGLVSILSERSAVSATFQGKPFEEDASASRLMAQSQARGCERRPLRPNTAQIPKEFVARDHEHMSLPSCDNRFAIAQGCSWANGNDQADRAISTGKLQALLLVHTRPIDVVVYHGPDREHWF